MIARDRAIRRVVHQQRASIDSTPLTSFQTSSAIKRNHKETTLRSRRLPLTPHHTFEIRSVFSDDDHRTRCSRRTGQRSDPAFIVERHTKLQILKNIKCVKLT
ncbi:hypothetical protein TNCV_5068821 [Trichonephila clavipes]|nr:hypothetical protein TNCV_5068821 [Trichonephila clavipes]